MYARRFLRVATISLFTLAVVPSAYPATWYVAPNGFDQNSGTIEAPFRTVQRGIEALEPGDTLRIRPGNYLETVVIERGGSPGLPVSITADPGAIFVSPNPVASLSAVDVRGSAGHLVLEGIEATGGYHETLFLRPGAHDVTIRSCFVHGNRSGLWIAGAERVRVENCVFTQNSAHGVRIFQQSRDITLSGTQAVDNDDGLGCSGDADGFSVSSDSELVLFEDCTARENGEDGFDLQAPATVHRSVSVDNGCNGLKFFRGGAAERVLSARNQVGINSTIAGPSPGGLVLNNCTVADNSSQQVLVRNSLAPESTYPVRLHNSILSGSGKALEVHGNVLLEESFNLFFRPDTAGPIIVLPGPDGPLTFSGQAVNAGLYRRATGLGHGSYAMDPCFGPGSADYTLRETSPAIDLADPATSYSADLFHRARPAGLRGDLGAIESPFSAPNHAPWADGGPPRSVVAGSWFRLSSYGSVDPDGNSLLFRWIVDPDLPPLVGAQVRHLFALPGIYSVLLEATDGRLSSTRVVPVQALYPPSEHSSHGSAVVPPAPLTVRLRSSLRAEKVIRVRVRNEDTAQSLEPLGHLIRLQVKPGTCPVDTVLSPPDFEPRLAGVQDTALVLPGRTRTARLRVLLTPAAAPSCHLQLQVETVHPQNRDPTPENDNAFWDLYVQGSF